MKKFWNFIKNEDTAETELLFNGPISEDSWYGDEVTPKLFRDELSKISGNLTVWLNSPGGDVFAASQIYTMLRNHKGKVTVKIDALAASAASVVAMAGDETYIAPTAMLMIHDPATIAMGNKSDMEKGNHAFGGGQGVHHQCLRNENTSQPCEDCQNDVR